MIINLAKTVQTELASEDDAYIHQEYRIKRISHDEYSSLAWQHRKDTSDQGDIPIVFERRTVRTVAGVEKPDEWELFDFSGKAAQFLLNRAPVHASDESQHPIYESLKICVEAVRALEKEKTNLTYWFEPESSTWNKTRLQAKYAEEFETQLKRSRLHKAWKENRANTEKVAAIQERVTAEYRIERDRITTRLEEIEKEIAALRGSFENEVYQLLAEKPEDLKHRIIEAILDEKEPLPIHELEAMLDVNGTSLKLALDALIESGELIQLKDCYAVPTTQPEENTMIADVPSLTQEQQHTILDLLARAKVTQLDKHIDAIAEYVYSLWQDWNTQADHAYDDNASNYQEVCDRAEVMRDFSDRVHAFRDWQHDGFPIDWQVLGATETDYQPTYTPPEPPTVEELKPLILAELANHTSPVRIDALRETLTPDHGFEYMAMHKHPLAQALMQLRDAGQVIAHEYKFTKPSFELNRDMNNNEPTTAEFIAVTTAPESYDGFGTKTIAHLPYKTKLGKQYRKVCIQQQHYEWQSARYGSGIHPTHTPLEFERIKADAVPCKAVSPDQAVIDENKATLEQPFFWLYDAYDDPKNEDGSFKTVRVKANLAQAVIRLRSGTTNNVFSCFSRHSDIVKALTNQFSDSEIGIYQYEEFCNIVSRIDPDKNDENNTPQPPTPNTPNNEASVEDKILAALEDGHIKPTRENTTNGDKVIDHATGKVYPVQGWVTEMMSRKTLLQVLDGQKSECIELTDTLTRLARPEVKKPEWLPTKGDRVVIKSEKRHGTIKSVCKYTYALQTDYSCTVYTDNGATFTSIKLDDLEPETAPPESVLLDPVVKGRPFQPFEAWNDIIRTRESIKFNYKSAKNARKACKKAQWTEAAKQNEQHLQHILDVFLDWENRLGDNEALLELTGELELEQQIRHAETRGEDTTALQQQLERSREHWEVGDGVSFRQNKEWLTGYRIAKINQYPETATLEDCESKKSVYAVWFGNLRRDRAYDIAAAEKPIERVTLNDVETAKLIRPELAAEFPGIKFSVKCQHLQINIEWLDGPAVSTVEDLLKRYCATWESYDGDGGCHHFKKEERDGKIVEYWNHGIRTHRNYSKPVIENAVAHLVEKYKNFDKLEIKYHFSDYHQSWSASADRGTTTDWDTADWFGREYRKYLEEWTNYEKPVTVATSNPVASGGNPGFCTVSRNEEKNGIEVRFKARVPDETVQPLTDISMGFRWSRRKPSYLYAKYTEKRWDCAIALAATLNGDQLTSDRCQSNEPETEEVQEDAIAQDTVEPEQAPNITVDNSEHYSTTPNISPIDSESSPLDKPEIVHTPPDLQRFDFTGITLEVWEASQFGAYYVTDETGKNIKSNEDRLFHATSHYEAAVAALDLWERNQELEQLKAELERTKQENQQLKEEIERLTPPPTPPSGKPPERSNNVVELSGKREEKAAATPISEAEQVLIDIVKAQSECFGSDVVALLEENRALMRNVLAEQKPKQTRKPKTEKLAPVAAKPRGRRKKDKVVEGQMALFSFSDFTQLNLFAV
jgi:hypothetical protein